MKTLLIVIFLFVTTIMVGQNLREVYTYNDYQGLHHVYFTVARAGETPICLGEEIFKNGEKVFDNYKENDR